MEIFDWSMDQRLLKVGWSFATMESGEQCVMTGGAEIMPWWCADS